MRILYMMALFTALSLTLTAQQGLESQLNMAESYEKSGDLKNAARVYSEVYRLNPKNTRCFFGLARTMKALNQYSGLLPFVEEQLNYTKSADIYILYGEVLWKTGKPKEAVTAWDQAIETAPGNEAAYDELSNVQINLMLFDKAIATLLKARKELDKVRIFSDKLCQLYIATGNYKDGVTEVLDALQITNNLQAAQGKLSALMYNEEARKYIRGVLESGSSGREARLKKLYGWFLSAGGEYMKALEVYTDLDKMSNAGGYEVYIFAQNLRTDGVYDIALKAYEYVLELGKAGSMFQQALYGYARTQEQKFSQDTVLNTNELKKVIELYEDISRQYPNTQIAWDCSVRIAEIYLYYLADNDAAVEELTSLIGSVKATNVKAEASNLLGDVYIAMDRLEDARSCYTLVRQLAGRVPVDELEKASYRLVEIEYYKGEIDTALAHFRDLSMMSGSNYSNDALNKIIIIEDNLKNKDAVVRFASAELKERQKKTAEAIDLYISTSQTAKGSTLAEKSLMKAAELRFGLKEYDKVREILNELMQTYPNTIYGDYAMMLVADSYYEQGRSDEAQKNYTELLKKYPRSIYLDKARDRIRKLRNS